MMKKYLLVALIHAALAINAQQRIPAINNTTVFPYRYGTHTDPANVSPTQTVAGRQFEINHFDWTHVSFGYNKSNYPGLLSPVTNPYYSTYTPNASIARGGLSDFRPDQGWELIRRDFGYYYDETSPIINNNRPIIYILLYNKFTAKLRLLCDLPNQVNGNLIQSVRVELEMVDKRTPISFVDFKNSGASYDISGLMSIADETGASTPLTEKSPRLAMSSVAIFPDSYVDFFYADFQMAYDPCTCLSESGLRFNFYEIQSSSLSAVGRLFLTSQTIASYNSANMGPYSTSIYYKNGTDVDNFQQNYKDFDDLALSLKTTSAIDPSFQDNANSGATELLSFLIELGASIGEIADVTTVVGGFHVAAATLNFISAHAGGESNSSGPVETLPTVIQGGVNISGQLNTQKLQSSYNIQLTNPGSKNSETRPEVINPAVKDPEYTTYNEVLGLFALIKKPVPLVNHAWDQVLIEDGGLTRTIYKNTNYSVKLADKLIYTYNPNIGIIKDKTSIYAALEVEITYPNNTSSYTNWNVTYTYDNCYHTLNYFENANPHHHDVFLTPFVPIECLSNLVPHINYTSPNGNSTGIDELPTINLRLKILFMPVFDQINISTNKKNMSSTVFTYNLSGYGNTSDDLIAGSNQIHLYGDITLPNPNINLNTNALYANKVTINGNISSGNNLKIYSINGFDVLPSGNIDPSIDLITGNSSTPWDCSTPIDPLLAFNDLKDFCEGNKTYKYQANIPALSPSYINNAENIDPIQNFKITPNPTIQSSNVQFNTLEETQGTLFVYDITGHLIKTVFNNRPLVKGDHNIGTDISDLAAGEYIVRLITTEGVQTAKLIKLGQ